MKSTNPGLAQNGKSVYWLGYSYDTNIVKVGVTCPTYSNFAHSLVDGEIYNFQHHEIESVVIFNSRTGEKIDVKGKVVKILTTEDSKLRGYKTLSFEILD